MWGKTLNFIVQNVRGREGIILYSLFCYNSENSFPRKTKPNQTPKNSAVIVNIKNLPLCNTSHLGIWMDLVKNLNTSDKSINIRSQRNGEIHGQGFFQMMTWFWLPTLRFKYTWLTKRTQGLKVHSEHHTAFQLSAKLKASAAKNWPTKHNTKKILPLLMSDTRWSP